jgi:hypothetical protein
LELRTEGKEWEHIAKQLPGRSCEACRLHYNGIVTTNKLSRNCWKKEKEAHMATRALLDNAEVSERNFGRGDELSANCMTCTAFGLSLEI